MSDKDMQKFFQERARQERILKEKRHEQLTAHAVKGICANLGLTKISEAASEIAEEYRPGNSRKLTDAEVTERLQAIAQMYDKTKAGIQKYEEA